MGAANDQLQAILDASGGGSVGFAPGTYPIDASRPLRVKSGTTLTLAGVNLVVIPTNLEKYTVLELKDVLGVTIKGGTLTGDRNAHAGKTGEWGFGLRIGGHSSLITVTDMLCQAMWGDGFYVGGGENVLIDGCKALNNRRQGLSITAGKNIKVTNSDFSQTHGTDPSDGIDIEPDKGGVVDGVSISGCHFANNAGSGVEIASKRGVVKGVKVRNCTFAGNKHNIKSNTYGWLENVLWQVGLWDPTEIEI